MGIFFFIVFVLLVLSRKTTRIFCDGKVSLIKGFKDPVTQTSAALRAPPATSCLAQHDRKENGKRGPNAASPSGHYGNHSLRSGGFGSEPLSSYLCSGRVLELQLKVQQMFTFRGLVLRVPDAMRSNPVRLTEPPGGRGRLP
ncbi:hypothetical protein OJAV_G00027260 [Oryzias javanicus]|uniref:Secreted protein n=1 Tax=Oryzias javanicus TaxID=123683 RepID=A0A3S2UNR6_ORYJA|nr:hypothetical protein OJAV_G00027260 [Oryzias javanicus]